MGEHGNFTLPFFTASLADWKEIWTSTATEVTRGKLDSHQLVCTPSHTTPVFQSLNKACHYLSRNDSSLCLCIFNHALANPALLVGLQGSVLTTRLHPMLVNLKWNVWRIDLSFKIASLHVLDTSVAPLYTTTTATCNAHLQGCRPSPRMISSRGCDIKRARSDLFLPDTWVVPRKQCPVPPPPLLLQPAMHICKVAHQALGWCQADIYIHTYYCLSLSLRNPWCLAPVRRWEEQKTLMPVCKWEDYRRGTNNNLTSRFSIMTRSCLRIVNGYHKKDPKYEGHEHGYQLDAWCHTWPLPTELNPLCINQHPWSECCHLLVVWKCWCQIWHWIYCHHLQGLAMVASRDLSTNNNT